MKPSGIVRIWAAGVAAATLVFALSACAPVVLGGAAVGAMVAVDRRTAGAQLEDESIELSSSSRIGEALGARVHVSVTSYNRRVLLTGEALNARDRAQVTQIVNEVENVRAVVNEIVLATPTSFAERSNDTYITGKVKASMLEAKDIFSNAFKVVTERGTVFLMGLVTQREADRATAVTRSVSGVQKVVLVLELITEQELQDITAAAAAAANEKKP